VIAEFRAIGYTLTTLGTKHGLASGRGAYRAAIVPRQAIRFNVDVSGCVHSSVIGKTHQTSFQSEATARAPVTSDARRHVAALLETRHGMEDR
jgi:hypothetical protein